MTRATSWTMAGAILLFAATASADAVPMPPDDDECPNGARGETCHGGPYCLPWACTSDGDCRDGRLCREAPLCVEDFDCTGGWGTYVSETVREVCTTEGSCGRGSCEVRRVCVRPGPPPPDASLSDADAPDGDAPDGGGFPSRQYGCGCASGEGSASASALLALATLGAVLLLHRGRS